jgi:PKD repeat protein
VIPNCGSESCTNGTNSPPVVAVPTASPSGPQPVGTSIQISANFTDPSLNQTHTCSINWDDGATTPGTMTEPSGVNPGTCQGVHTYNSPGVYTVTVTVTDSCNSSGESKYEFVVIYDPNGGFVTGGGWIDSPPGAYTADPTLTGKANFGFVSKYKKGSSVPEGETEFQFKAGDLNFHSSIYDFGSLVISGYKAQYRGTGTVNGASGYRFVLTAYDGQVTGGGGVDKFRIKITQNGVVIYDNRLGASEDIDTEPTAISGGSIVIHKGK